MLEPRTHTVARWSGTFRSFAHAKAAPLLGVFLMTFALAACGPAQKNSSTQNALGDVFTNIDGVGLDTAMVTDVSDSDSKGLDGSSVDADNDAESTPATCDVAADCEGKLTLKSCQQSGCEQGLCVALVKPGMCCEVTDCDDGQECTIDECDTAKQTCQNLPKVNCCSGKLTFAKIGFESAQLTELTPAIVSGSAGKAPVSWQIRSERARVGAKSLYLGNACDNYATNVDPNNDCAAEGDAEAVLATLDSKSFTLPADKTSQLHFWFWAEVEPAYAKSLPAGTCNPSCSIGSTCINVNGASQCITEKDVLTLSVQTSAGAVKVFDSTQMGKSTAGGWQRVAIDLSGFTGQTIKFTWRFETGTGLKNEFEGIWLDEIVLETVCAVQGTLCEQDQPCLDDKQGCTIDSCTTYSNTPDKGFCFHDVAIGCCTLTSQCDDGDSCTVDTCDQGTCKSKPDSTQLSCCKASTQWFEDFGSGVLADWTIIDGNSTAVQWRIDPLGGVQGSQALYFGSSNFSSYQDTKLSKGVGPKGTACSKLVKVPVGSVYNQAVFQVQLETEWSYLPKAQYKNPPLSSQPKFDHLLVSVLEAGASKAVWSSDLVYGTTDGKWHQVVISLVPWQGKEVQVCLSFDAGDDKVNDKKGVHVDDFSMRVACDQKDCYYDVDCNISCASCEAPACVDGGCTCVPLLGCCTQTSDCSDGNPCTIAQCIQGQCKNDKKPQCCTQDSECPSPKPCKQGLCDLTLNTCSTKPVTGCCEKDADCQDKDACSSASCDVSNNQCKQTPKTSCCLQAAQCDDQNACTTDTCAKNKCVYIPSGAAGCG
ncbi:MAG: hypothetical protein CMH53_01210 [Myxococcales bacterium]|nr:hypothetical protein [Myxococcales bacterium]